MRGAAWWRGRREGSPREELHGKFGASSGAQPGTCPRHRAGREPQAVPSITPFCNAQQIPLSWQHRGITQTRFLISPLSPIRLVSCPASPHFTPAFTHFSQTPPRALRSAHLPCPG